ncbi:MAG: hypothetical protein IJ298_08995 [Ruminococcus sp.]|nr:hypothetical protein [Ruminococcus sp.]
MKKIISFMLGLCFCFSVVCTVSATTEKGKYEDLFVERLSLHYSDGDRENESYYDYSECYEYYDGDNVSSYDESTPDYVLVFAATIEVSPMIYREYIGPYVVVSYNYRYPSNLGYYIYIPLEDKICTLKEAYDEGVEGIDEAFYNYMMIRGLTGVLGDADGDNELTIKDATWIQKKVAKIKVTSPFVKDEVELAVTDFDRDCEVTIKDATAIQKHVAGLEY